MKWLVLCLAVAGLSTGALAQNQCPPPKVVNAAGACVCPSGTHEGAAAANVCVPDTCPSPQVKDAKTGACVCPSPRTMAANGRCVCPIGSSGGRDGRCHTNSMPTPYALDHPQTAPGGP